ncbi:hypothetical protein FRB97_006493 [Tulasnella sp. 331]|nr:hypothetical protein FRB97_006493 [Tulasnella sp. 331]
MSVSSSSLVSSTLNATMPTTIPSSNVTSIRGRVKAFGLAVQQSLNEADTSMKGSSLLSFMLSEYNAGVVMMGFVLDRIQHVVVVPPRRENPTHLQHNAGDDLGGGAAATSRLRRFWNRTVSRLLPIDASAVHTRFFLRLPSLILLYRALVLNLLLILQITSCLPDSWTSGPIMRWAVTAKMTDVSWAAYIATCLTLATIAFNNGLDGSGSGGSALSFNLFNAAMEYHVLSTARAHIIQPEGLPPRPDLIGLLAMLAPLSDLTIYNTMGIRKSWGHKRFIPSAVAFVLEYTKHRLAADLPSSHYLARNYDGVSLVYTFLLGVIGTTWLLKSSTAILLGGSISGNLLPANLTLSLDDHVQVVLIKLLTASVQTTGMSGFANELPVLNAYDDDDAQKGRREGAEDAVAHIGLDGTVMIVPGGAGGLAREIKTVKPQVMESSDPILGGWGSKSRWHAIRNLTFSAWRCWKYTFWRLWVTLARAVMGRSQTGATHSPRIPKTPMPPAPSQTTGGKALSSPQDSDAEDEEQDEGKALYQRFLRGASILSNDSSASYQSGGEDEDDQSDWESDDESSPIRGTSRELSTTPQPGDHGHDDRNGSLALYDATTDDPSILLAHMLNTTPQPLTRRRYQATSLVLSPRRPTSTKKQASRDADDSEKQTCIVCYSEPRLAAAIATLLLTTAVSLAQYEQSVDCVRGQAFGAHAANIGTTLC